jgi:hypothetical protein
MCAIPYKQGEVTDDNKWLIEPDWYVYNMFLIRSPFEAVTTALQRKF